MITKIFSTTLISAALLATNAQGQNAAPKLIEKVDKKAGEVSIPYEKWELPNGLTVVIHEDHSDPIAYVDVTYHVGSNREQVGRSGFAHFFEHMMFQGSDHVADEEHFKTVTEVGGTLNGSTNFDRTNYFETAPSNSVETMIWLEADRMGFLLDAVTQQKFEVQRATVKNERGQNYDNRPYGLIYEKTFEALFPYGHPYSWSTIGYLEDLDRVDVNDLKRFFMRWYGPNNATLTVAGDVKPADIVKMAEKYFGPIPRGPEVKDLDKMPAKLDKSRYISYEDNIRFPMLMITYPSVNAYHKDEAALDALASILGEDKNSIFYQNFVKKQVAYDASVYNWSSEIAGMFSFAIRSMPTKNLAFVDSLVSASMAEFEKKGVSDDDLKKFKANYESNTINSLSSVRGKGAQLAAYQTFTRNPNQIKLDMDRYRNVTKEDVVRVYNQYIKGKNAVYLSVYPKGKPEVIAKPNNFEAPKRNPEDGKESDEYKNLSYTKPKDNFDRSKKPASGPNPVVQVPTIWKSEMPNGLKLIGTQNDEVPSVSISISIDAGHRYEPMNKSGLANLTAQLMNEGTESFTAEQISEKLGMLGSSISVGAGDDDVVMSISSLTKNLDATLKIAEEMLFRPKFDEADFKRLKEEQMQTISNQSTQPRVIASNAFSKLVYGKDHILSMPVIGTEKSVESITLDDVKNYYKQNLSPSVASVVVSGDVSETAALEKLGFLKNWKATPVTKPTFPASPAIDKTRIYFINKDKAPQSEVRIGYMALPYDATGEFYKAYLMNFMLGGAFNSRININLRETKGWTYGARSGFSGDKYAGPFTAGGGIKGNATDSSIVEFMKEIKGYAIDGIKPEEWKFVQNSIGQQDALKYETNGQKAGFIKRILDYNLPMDFVSKQQEILKSMTIADVNALAKKHLPYDNMVIVIVGDKEKLMERVKKLGYEVVELDADGETVK